MNQIPTGERGFVALISVIIVSAILLVLLFTLGAASFLSRFSVLDSENKRISLALAEACANTAMIRISQNSQYGISPALPAGGDCVGVGGGVCPPSVSPTSKTCRICRTSPTILTRAVYNGAYTNLEIA